MCTLLVTGHKFFLPLTADAELVSGQARPVHAREPFSHSQRVSYGCDQWSVLVQDNLLPIAVEFDLAKGQGDLAGQDKELVARVLLLLCLCVGRRFRELVRTDVQICDVTDVVHVDRDDLDVGWFDGGILFWSAGEENNGTSVRSLLIGFGAAIETAIPDAM